MELGTSSSEEAFWWRRSVKIGTVPRDSIMVVWNEDVCREASRAYWSVLSKTVSELGFPTDGAVLVVRIGNTYLVDDLRNRREYWEVTIFDARWKRLYGYGGGA